MEKRTSQMKEFISAGKLWWQGLTRKRTDKIGEKLFEKRNRKCRVTAQDLVGDAGVLSKFRTRTPCARSVLSGGGVARLWLGGPCRWC